MSEDLRIGMPGKLSPEERRQAFYQLCVDAMLSTEAAWVQDFEPEEYSGVATFCQSVEERRRMITAQRLGTPKGYLHVEL